MFFFPSVTRDQSRYSPFTRYIGQGRISVADYFQKKSQRLHLRAQSCLSPTPRESSHLPNAARRSVADHSKFLKPRSLSGLDHCERSNPPPSCTILNSERFIARTPCYKNIIEPGKSPRPRQFPTINPEKLRRRCVFEHSQFPKARSGRVFGRSQLSSARNGRAFERSQLSGARSGRVLERSQLSSARSGRV